MEPTLSMVDATSSNHSIGIECSFDKPLLIITFEAMQKRDFKTKVRAVSMEEKLRN